MADPVHPGQDEADHEGHQRRPELGQGLGEGVALGELGDVDLQDQQGDDDGEHPIGQGEDPGRIMQLLQQLRTRFAAVPRRGDGDLSLVGHLNLPPQAKPAERCHPRRWLAPLMHRVDASS